MTEKKGGSMMRDPEKEYENAMDVMMEMKARDEDMTDEDMTTEEASDVLRNAAWLGTDADRERIENAVEMAINALTAQPETHDKRTETHTCDCISRQAAIDAHYEYCNKHPDAGFPVWSLKILEDLPPAQPETHEKRTETHACVRMS